MAQPLAASFCEYTLIIAVLRHDGERGCCMKAKITTTEKLVPIMARLEESTLRDVGLFSNLYRMSRNALINEMLKSQLEIMREEERLNEKTR